MNAKAFYDRKRPLNYPYSSAYCLKAVYQRYMLIGLMGAVLFVAVPTMIVTWWLSKHAPIVPDVPSRSRAADTVIIDLPITPVRIAPPDGEVVRGRVIVTSQEIIGRLVHDIALVPDSLSLDGEESQFGEYTSGDLLPEGEGGELEFGDGFGSGFGGTVFVPETTVFLEDSPELDRKPSLVAMPEPEYPPLAKRAGVAGRAVLAVRVGYDGFPQDIEIVSEDPAGYGFGRYAVKAAQKAVFVPALYHQEPVFCLVTMEIEFVLNE